MNSRAPSAAAMELSRVVNRRWERGDTARNSSMFAGVPDVVEDDENGLAAEDVTVLA